MRDLSFVMAVGAIVNQNAAYMAHVSMSPGDLTMGAHLICDRGTLGYCILTFPRNSVEITVYSNPSLFETGDYNDRASVEIPELAAGDPDIVANLCAYLIKAYSSANATKYKALIRYEVEVEIEANNPMHAKWLAECMTAPEAFSEATREKTVDITIW